MGQIKQSINVIALQRFLALSKDEIAPQYVREVDCTDNIDSINTRIKNASKVLSQPRQVILCQ